MRFIILTFGLVGFLHSVGLNMGNIGELALTGCAGYTLGSMLSCAK